VFMNTYENHIHDLAKSHEVEVIYRGNGRACRSKRWITIPPIKGQVTYLLALHELGHIVGPNPRLRLEQEVEAWRWALDHAECDPTPATIRSIVRRLESYERRARRWKNMQTPPEFIAYLERLRGLCA
jgi:hypothetical protein